MSYFDSIRDILVKEWDPLDIGSNIKLFDEYDEVVREIMIFIGHDDQLIEIARTLLRYETAYEIDPVNPDRAAKVASMIVKL